MKKQKLLAAALNLLVPGLGTAYGRKIRKASMLYVVFLVIAVAWRFVAFNYDLFIGCIATVIGFWAYLLISGYRDVPNDMTSTESPFSKGYFFGITFLHFIVVGFILTFVFNEVTPINFAKVPTPSMDPGLMVGDRLAYRKTSSIKRYDVVLFWVPYDPKIMYAQRCIGLPGDILTIDNAIVSINNTPLNGLPVKYRYQVKTNGSEISSRVLDGYHITEHDLQRVAHDTYFLFLTDQSARSMSNTKFIQKLERSIAVKGEREPGIFPDELITHDWNADFYGPIYIPKRGGEVELTADNVAIYREIIDAENGGVEVSESGLIIDGRPVTHYEFKNNYYFIMGDNRHNSLDSRYWGLLPESLVIGKGLYIYWSEISGRIGKSL